MSDENQNVAKKYAPSEAQVQGALKYYLPQDRFGEAESCIRFDVAGPLVSDEVIRASEIDRLAAAYIGLCIDYAKTTLEIDEDIRFVFVDSHSRNAWAIGSKNIIIISTALIFGLGALTANLNQSPHYISALKSKAVNIGNKKGDKSRRAAIHELLKPVPGKSGLIDLGVFPFCLNFIALHELGHLINGHLRTGLIKASTIAEMSPRRESDDERLTRRTLEFDADCFAIQHQIRMMTFMVQNGIFKTRLGNPLQQGLVCALMGIYLVMCAMDTNDDISVEDAASYTHPAAPLRASYAKTQLAAVFELFQRDNPAFPTDALITYFHIIVGVENAIAETGGTAANGYLQEKWEAFSLPDLVVMLQRWAKIRPQLEAAKYGNHKLALASEPPS